MEFSTEKSSVKADYFQWLCERVGVTGMSGGESNYYILLGILHNTPFRYYIPQDENRAEDGKELRKDYAIANCAGNEFEALNEGDCSVLEMLVALASRMEFELSGPNYAAEPMEDECFWMLIENLGLSKYTDESGYGWKDSVLSILNRFMERRYDANGRGGLFPLSKTTTNQRTLEIWYQMHAWIFDNFG